jgi:5-methyltetrahydrofolate--homocysteine methyltransferase
MHTAVKIAPEFDRGVVHVLDASRSVTVVGSLLSPEQKPDFLKTIRTEYTKLKEDFGNKKSVKQYLPFAKAQENKVPIAWDQFKPVKPTFIGTRAFDNQDLAEIVQYIDWGPFFIAWELHGKYPQILQDQVVGAEATRLHNDALALLDRIVQEKWLRPRAVIGFWPAGSDGKDTIFVDTPKEKVHLECLRQQIKKAPGQPNLSLADFIKPTQDNNLPDHIGAFAVTIEGIEPHIKKFEAAHDDYNKIMLQALADRLAEAYTELIHEKVRKEYWGYVAQEHLSNDQLIREEYQGIRPAPGYPACPDHTEKRKMFEMLDATRQTGIILTESLAMFPASSVSGWYFAHPESKYFGVGKIEKDQVEDYAARKKMSLEETERWLRPILEYDA